MPAKHFDALDFVKKSKALGVNDELAEYQARQLENVIDIASFTAREEFNVHELATKTDLKQLEADLKIEMKQLDLKIEQYHSETKTDLKQLEVAMKTDLKQLESDLKIEMKQLEVKIEQYRYDTLKFVIWTGVGVVISLGGLLCGLLAKGFHWFG